MEIDIIEPLLKQYKDAELIHYVRRTIDSIMNSPISNKLSAEAILAQREQALVEPLRILRAVDNRMNKRSNDPKIVM